MKGVEITRVELGTTLVTGQKLVASAGTEVSITGGTETIVEKGVYVKALSTNATSTFVGLTGVTTSTGYELTPGTDMFIPIRNIALVFIDSATSSTDGVSFCGI